MSIYTDMNVVESLIVSTFIYPRLAVPWYFYPQQQGGIDTIQIVSHCVIHLQPVAILHLYYMDIKMDG